MKMTYKKYSILSMAIISLSTPFSVNAACELDDAIQIADMSWSSASAIAHIESIIIETGYGCKTELVPGDGVTTATTMVNKGRPHVAPELWANSATELLEEGERRGTISIAGNVFSSGGSNGWFIPGYLSKEYPDLKRVEDLPQYRHLFKDPDDDNKGRFYNSLPGWTSETRSTNLIKGYGLDEYYNLFSAGSGAALDAAIVSHYKRKKPIVFFYWGPSAMLGEYDMVQLGMNDYDPENDSCNAEADCAEPVAGGFPVIAVNTVVANKIKEDAPSVYAFLQNVSFENDTINRLLAWGVDNQAEPEEIAEYFLENHQDIWSTWVPDDVADKVISNI